MTPSLMTKTIRDTVQYICTNLGFLPSEVPARLSRSAGAMASLVAEIDLDIIQILGRWHSDKMLCYLHLLAKSTMTHVSAKTIQAHYILAPTQLVLCY